MCAFANAAVPSVSALAAEGGERFSLAGDSAVIIDARRVIVRIIIVGFRLRRRRRSAGRARRVHDGFVIFVLIINQLGRKIIFQHRLIRFIKGAVGVVVGVFLATNLDSVANIIRLLRHGHGIARPSRQAIRC